jgi:hypothetical protein
MLRVIFFGRLAPMAAFARTAIVSPRSSSPRAVSGVLKSLGHLSFGPVGLVHTHNFRDLIRKAHLFELHHLDFCDLPKCLVDRAR